MAIKRMCYICKIRPAEVPDRYTGGRPIARICRECHAKRLADDLHNIVVTDKNKKREV